VKKCGVWGDGVDKFDYLIYFLRKIWRRQRSKYQASNETGGVNLQEIGEMLALDYSSVSVSRKRCRVTADEDRKYLRLAERIESKLIQE
jgi:hypothetical protein